MTELEKAATEFADSIKNQTFNDDPQNFKKQLAANMRYEGFLMGARWITEKAADWIEEYLGEGNTIEDWYRDSKVLKNGREAFLKNMKE